MRSMFLPLLLLSTLSMYIVGCQKKDIQPLSENSQLIATARNYLKENLQNINPGALTNYRLKKLPPIDWNEAEVVELTGRKVVRVPVNYDSGLVVRTNFGNASIHYLRNLTHLLFYKVGDSSKLEIVTAFPDSSYSRGSQVAFSGILFVESLEGQLLKQLKVSSDGLIYVNHGPQKVSSHLLLSEGRVSPNMYVTMCYEIEGYNYEAGNPEGGYSWVEDAGCSTTYIPDDSGTDGGGGGGGSGGLSGPDYGSAGTPSSNGSDPTIAVDHGPNMIGNINDYLGCFTNVGGTDHHYTVTLCVKQPIPGTREPWGWQNSPDASSAASNPFNVGHVFLIFNEAYGSTNIRRSVGFYPSGRVNPKYPTSQGELDNNDQSAFDISLTMRIDNGQFFNMLNFVSQGNNPGYLYDLNSNNCTNFAINTLQAAGISMTWHTGSWPFGSGYNPGDMGEDIRIMPLSNNMFRSSTPLAHPNLGSCMVD